MAGSAAARRQDGHRRRGLGVVGLVIVPARQLRRGWRGRAGGVRRCLGQLGQGGQPATADNSRDRPECKTGAGRQHQARLRGRRRHRLDPGATGRPSCPSSARATRRSPTVWFTGQVSDRLRRGQQRAGPFYCPADKTRLHRPDLLQLDLQTQFGATGGLFVDAYVLAHEYGHHVQDLLGIEAKVQARRDRADVGLGAAGAAGRLLRRRLGQARHRAAANGKPALVTDITDQDITNALDTAGRIGDDYIQTRTWAADVQSEHVHARHRRRSGRSGSPPATRPATRRPATPSAPNNLWPRVAPSRETQTLKPRARSCSRPSSVILSGPHGGIQTQLILTSDGERGRAAGQGGVGLVLDDVGQRAGGRGQGHVDGDDGAPSLGLVDAHVVDQAEVDDVDAEFGVDDVAHRLVDLVAGRRS